MSKITAKELIKRGFPKSAVLGVLLAMIIGVGGLSAGKIKDFYQYKEVFPESEVIEKITDGDTVELSNGLGLRLLGINAPGRGEPGYNEASEGLKNLVLNKKVWLEYDRYQDDKNGRILAYLWINCETEKPKFLLADYMHLDGKTSRDYVTENPDGCKNGLMVNREMVKMGFAKSVVYEGRGRLKYKI